VCVYSISVLHTTSNAAFVSDLARNDSVANLENRRIGFVGNEGSSRILKAVGTFDDHLLHPNQSGQSPHVLPLMRLGKSRGLFGDVKKSWASPLQFRRHPQC